MYYVYILLRKDGKYYCWSTIDVNKRLFRHNAWSVQSTRHYRPLQLLYSREYKNKEDAIKIEKKLKKSKTRRVIEEFMSGYW